MELADLKREVQTLRDRSARLERRQRRFLAGGLLAVAVVVHGGWQGSEAPPDNFKTRAISILDKRGVVRLAIGAPVPNPVVNGKTMERRAPAIGMIFK